MDYNFCPHIPILECFLEKGGRYKSPEAKIQDLKKKVQNALDVNYKDATNKEGTLTILCPATISGYISPSIIRALQLRITNGCAQAARNHMKEGSLVFGLSSVSKSGKRIGEDYAIIYAARIDHIDGTGNEREGISNCYWYFGAQKPYPIDDKVIRDGLKERFNGAGRGMGRSIEYDWISDALSHWFLSLNIVPGIKGFPRQSKFNPHINSRKDWLYFPYDLEIVTMQSHVQSHMQSHHEKEVIIIE